MHVKEWHHIFLELYFPYFLQVKCIPLIIRYLEKIVKKRKLRTLYEVLSTSCSLPSRSVKMPFS